MSSWQRLAEFGKGILERATKLLGAKPGALLLKQETAWEVDCLAGLGRPTSPGTRQFAASAMPVAEALSPDPGTVGSVDGKESFWRGVGRFSGLEGMRSGAATQSCRRFDGRPVPGELRRAWSEEEKEFLQTIAGHASSLWKMPGCLPAWIAPTGTGWKSSMPSAISSWCTTRPTTSCGSIARWPDFIGVPPRELIGVNMCALLAMDNAAPLRACPFCRGGRRRNRRIRASGAGQHLPGFHLPRARRHERGVADHPRAQGHYRPPRGGAPLSRTLRQHSGGIVLLHSRRRIH